MKKVSKTATYKFNIRKTVSFSTTMRFSIDATKRAVEHAFTNAGLDPLTVAQNTIKELNIRLIESESENSLLKIKVESLLKENTEYKNRNQGERKKIAEEVVKYWRDEIKSEKEKNKKKGRVEVFITADGLIYREPKAKHYHRIEIKNGRGKLILAMLGKKSYIPTQSIIEVTGLCSSKSVEGASYQMRKDIEKKLGIANFIDGYQDYGYRINPSLIFKKA